MIHVFSLENQITAYQSYWVYLLIALDTSMVFKMCKLSGRWSTWAGNRPPGANAFRPLTIITSSQTHTLYNIHLWNFWKKCQNLHTEHFPLFPLGLTCSLKCSNLPPTTFNSPVRFCVPGMLLKR